MSNSILGNARLRQLAVMIGGVGIGPFFLRLCTALGAPLGSRSHDSVAPLALWLTSSTAQVCAAALLVIGAALRMAGNVQGKRAGMPEGDRRRAEAHA